MSYFKTIFGCNVLTVAKISLWICGITIMVCLSIKDLYPIFRDYLDVDTNVNVLIDKIEGQTIRKPHLYACMPISGDQFIEKIVENEHRRWKRGKSWLIFENDTGACPMCDGLKNNSWDVWTHLDFSGATDNKTLVTEIILAYLDKIFSNLPTIDNLLSPNNSGWHQPIVESILLLFSYVNQNDAKFLRKEYVWNKKMNPIENFIAQRSNSELDRLYHAIIKHKARLLKIEGINGEEKFVDKEKLLANSFLVTHDAYTFCFQIRNLTSFYIEAEPEFFKYSVKWHRFIVTPTRPLDYFPPLFYSKNTPRDIAGEPPREAVALTYSVHSMVREERPGKNCYKHESQNDCLKECRTKRISNLCSCVPFTTKVVLGQEHQGDQMIPFCNPGHYEKCIDEFAKVGPCIEKVCKVACEFVFYQYHIIASKNGSEPHISLTVEPAVSPFMAFTLAVKDTRSNLISQVGGIFNFYLGMSGLSIIAVLIYMIDFSKRWRRAKVAHFQQNEYENGTDRNGAKPNWFRHTAWAIKGGNVKRSEIVVQKEMRNLKKSMEDLTAEMDNIKSQFNRILKFRDNEDAQKSVKQEFFS